MASPQQVGNTVGVATSAEEQRGRTLETIAIIGGTADLFEEMPEQLAIITGCMAQLAEGLRTNISRMDQINRALTRDVATLRYQTRAQQDHSETDSDHGEPCEPDTSRQSDMQERPVTTTPEPPESAHRIGDEPVDQEEQHPERAVPPYPPLSPAPPPTLRGSVPELKTPAFRGLDAAGRARLEFGGRIYLLCTVNERHVFRETRAAHHDRRCASYRGHMAHEPERMVVDPPEEVDLGEVDWLLCLFTAPPGGFTADRTPTPTSTSPDFRHQLSLYRTSRRNHHRSATSTSPDLRHQLSLYHPPEGGGFTINPLTTLQTDIAPPLPSSEIIV
ncbi:hypothetical protein GE061_016260 [Apolygus lucorum]|uniref:Uncharacterized protein n=2 Tax=Apolygus lucorum TaxID=248454 RepID=A0A8S9XHP4_APOLU|nr:hypothetical protein GE061_016260 [Apolygus lucorum]